MLVLIFRKAVTGHQAFYLTETGNKSSNPAQPRVFALGVCEGKKRDIGGRWRSVDGIPNRVRKLIQRDVAAAG